jgi:ribosomal-protein-alanine N-acetyltransferase
VCARGADAALLGGPSTAPLDRMLDATLYQTPRLALRPPRHDDAQEVFQRIASDPEVTRFVGWPIHTSLRDTEAFLSFSQAEWTKWPVGPLLITSQRDGAILGSTGLAFETSYRASTGFVLAKDAWGSGFASEALAAVVNIASALSVRRLYALCHVQHAKSVRVLERCGFVREGTLHKHTVFPNLGVSEPQDVYCYARMPDRLHPVQQSLGGIDISPRK